MSEGEGEKLTPDEIRRLLQVMEHVERLDTIIEALLKEIMQAKGEKEAQDER